MLENLNTVALGGLVLALFLIFILIVSLIAKKKHKKLNKKKVELCKQKL